MTLSIDRARDREIHGDTVMESAAAIQAEWDEDIRLRVEQIRNGTAGPDLQEVIAELDRCDAEFGDLAADDEDGDLADLEAAWSNEIEERLREIRDGTVRTYAAEDVMAALRARFG